MTGFDNVGRVQEGAHLGGRLGYSRPLPIFSVLRHALDNPNDFSLDETEVTDYAPATTGVKP